MIENLTKTNGEQTPTDNSHPRPLKTVNMADVVAESLQDVLTRFIRNGVEFNVFADGFRVTDSNQRLKAPDKNILKFNNSDVLCYLQQSVLRERLFSHSPEQFADFAFEIRERESLLPKAGKTPFEIYGEAVKQVTRQWFADLLEKKT